MLPIEAGLGATDSLWSFRGRNRYRSRCQTEVIFDCDTHSDPGLTMSKPGRASLGQVLAVRGGDRARVEDFGAAAHENGTRTGLFLDAERA